MPFDSLIQILRSRLFIGLSLFIAATNGFFVWINHNAHDAQVQRHLEQRAYHLSQLFEAQVSGAGLRMQQIASYIAALPNVQALLAEGVRAAETQGPDSPTAKLFRSRLLSSLAEPWAELQDHYDTRQLHFQYGQQATSFLRVHAPDKYGDTLETVRHTVLTTLRTRQPVLGFECGRVVCGIRGVVPLFRDGVEDAAHFIGVLEAGTSFRNALSQIEQVSGARFAVLLHDTYVRNRMWPWSYDRLLSGQKRLANFVLEDSLHEDQTRAWLARPEVRALARDGGTRQLKLGDRPYALIAFPLRDYVGAQSASSPDAGVVLAWIDISNLAQARRENLIFNLAYAALAFLLLEGLLIFSFRIATRHLEQRIQEQTHALHEMAIHDPLTGLYNRHHLNDFLEKEIQRARRAGRPMSIAILDLDHFKAVNDAHGHLRGDAVLVDAARLLHDRLRSSDLVFRYGGEEFLVLFTESSLQQAESVCNELRGQLAASSLAGLPKGSVTASFGVSDIQLSTPRAAEDCLKRADAALYRAKGLGRNRVETASTEPGTTNPAS